MTHGGNMAYAPSDIEFLIAELESPDDYDGILAGIETMPPWMQQIPKAVVTTFSPLRDPQGIPLPGKARPLIEAGFSCLPECDLPANANATPDRMDFEAKQLGWEYTVPGFYAYGGMTVDDYAQWADWQFGTWTWLAEYVL